jgi:hypothetical protein
VSPIRRDAEDGRMADRSWESLTERIIREAQERGDFSELPLHGKPFPNRSNPYAGERGLAFDVLHNAGVAPPWIEADKEAREWLARRDALLTLASRTNVTMRRTLTRELTDVVQRYNDAVARLNAGAPTERQHRREMNLARELASLEAALSASQSSQPEPA